MLNIAFVFLYCIKCYGKHIFTPNKHKLYGTILKIVFLVALGCDKQKEKNETTHSTLL